MEFHKAKTWDGETRYPWIHAKLDGHRLKIVATADDLSIYTTHPHNITEKLWDHPAVQHMREALPPGTELDCEIHFPGRPASDMKTYINVGDSRLRFGVFAVPSLDPHMSLDAVHRYVQEDLGLEFIEYWSDAEWDWDKMLPKDDLAADVPKFIEGFVLKQSNLQDWAKFKYEATIDLVVTGFKDGKGKNEGFVGSLICSTSEGHEVANAGGMDDETRWAIREADDLGRVVEIKYQYVGANGRLRHPRFVRWRDDKKCTECPASQDPKLKEYWDANPTIK
jgi:ATP-dependent DNA ligase